MGYKILYAKSVKKDIKDIPVSDLLKIKSNIEMLEHFPNVPNYKKLSSYSIADLRLRVGDYRVLFDIDYVNTEIHILKIGHRKDIY